jgi:predicted RNA-binding Zn-ribbon protein involved in translation (DUF1610 family)
MRSEKRSHREIKPDTRILTVNCPSCGSENDIDVGETQIEYQGEWSCVACGHQWMVRVANFPID